MLTAHMRQSLARLTPAELEIACALDAVYVALDRAARITEQVDQPPTQFQLEACGQQRLPCASESVTSSEAVEASPDIHAAECAADSTPTVSQTN